jgi:hypothetical protein
MHTRLRIIFGLSIVCAWYIADGAHIPAGTLVALSWTPSKFAIAADSRQHWENEIHPPSDDQCKIIPIGKRFVFSQTNSTGYIGHNLDAALYGWNNADEARHAVALHSLDKGDAAVVLRQVVQTWSDVVASKWNRLYTGHPALVNQAATHGSGTLTNAVFAFADQNSVAVETVSVVFENGIASVRTIPCPAGIICFGGRIAIATEFQNQTSLRAAKEHQEWAASHPGLPDSDIVRLIRYVDLTINYDQTGDVGGAIDALELDAKSGMHWVQRKSNCPAE